MMHPIFFKRKYVIYYLVIWFLIVIIHIITLNHYYNFSQAASIMDSLVFNTFFAVIAIGLWYTVRYNNLDHARPQDILMNHAGVAVVSLAVWFFSGYYILHELFLNDKDYLQYLGQSVPWRLATGFFFYALTILLYYLYISYRNLQEKIKNESDLKTLVKETELNMLKSQINPHFLFNSLNSISSLTITNPDKAQEMIIKLSEFLRHSISHKQDQMVPLKEEVEHILLYLDIEKVRFGNRLQYNFKIGESCRNFPLPSMILQPIFENAIKHGVYESSEEVTIDFICQPYSDGMLIKISNDYDPETPARPGNRMGLKNISNRLKLIYQYEDLLKVRKRDKKFEVELFVPESPVLN